VTCHMDPRNVIEHAPAEMVQRPLVELRDVSDIVERVRKEREKTLVPTLSTLSLAKTDSNRSIARPSKLPKISEGNELDKEGSVTVTKTKSKESDAGAEAAEKEAEKEGSKNGEKGASNKRQRREKAKKKRSSKQGTEHALVEAGGKRKKIRRIEIPHFDTSANSDAYYFA
jgi:hypothetical protein